MAKHDRRPRHGSTREAGLRGQRLEELFREELNSLFDSEITDPRLEGARVTRVELSRDGSCARVWLVMLKHPFTEATQSALKRASGFLRSRLGEALPLKRLPDLRFRHDPTAVYEPPKPEETM
jgi:ribosome-binding factor A